MNKLRERILTDKGFTYPNETRAEEGRKVEELTQELANLRKKLADRDKYWQNLRNVELNKAVDSVQAKKKELNALRKKFDRLEVKAKKLEGENAQLKKEIKEIK